MLVVARAVASAVAALNELSAAVLNDEAADSAANELRALAPPWWTRNDDDAARARQREALTEHASEPWQLLRAGLELRLSEAAATRAAPLLAFETFVAMLAALEWRILALHAPEAPLGDYCRRLVRADVGTQIRATRACSRRFVAGGAARDAGACRRRWRGAARCVTGDGGGGRGGGGAAGRGAPGPSPPRWARVGGRACSRNGRRPP